MKLTFYSDLHFYAVHEINETLVFNDTTYFIGDIVDLRGCKNSEVEEVEAKRIEIQEKSKGKYLNGNHELAHDSEIDIILDGICITHGDVFDHDSEKYYDWHYKKQPGSTWFRRFYIGIAYWFRENFQKSVSKACLQKAATYACSEGCHTIVFGHKHPNKVVDKMINETRVICVPRGKTEIEF